MADPVFKRILLKLSGEALMGSLEYGTDAERVEGIARQVSDLAKSGVEVAVVVGAGNIYRGLSARQREWTARPPTTWACSPRSSTR